MSYVTSTTGSSVDPQTEPMTKSTSTTPRSDPPSTEIEKASRCSPQSEEADGTQACTTEQISLSHSDTISASKDISNQSTTPDTQRVEGTPTIPA